MLPLATCAPHELIDIRELQQLDVTLFEETVWGSSMNWP